MGSQISSVLVQEGLLEISELQDALASQVVRGGALDTILLERGLVPESTLTELLSSTSGFVPIHPETLDAADPHVSDLVPLTTIENQGFSPIYQDDAGLHLLATDICDGSLLPALADRLGLRLIPEVGTELRLRQAYALIYNQALTARFSTLIDRYGERPASVYCSTEDSTPRGILIIPKALRQTRPAEHKANADKMDHFPQIVGERFPQIVGEEAKSLPPTPAAQPPSTVTKEHARPKAHPSRALSHPQTTESFLQWVGDEAQTAFLDAHTKEEILEVLVRSIGSALTTVHLFIVRGDRLVPRLRKASNTFEPAMADVREIDLASTPLLARIVREGATHIGPLSEEGVPRPGRNAPRKKTSRPALTSSATTLDAAIVPLRLRDKTVALIIGHRDGGDIPTSLRDVLATLANLAAKRLAELIVSTRTKAPHTPTTSYSSSGTDRDHISGEIGSAEPERTRRRKPSVAEKVILSLDVSTAGWSFDELLHALEREIGSRPANPNTLAAILAEFQRRKQSAIPWLIEHFPGTLRWTMQELIDRPTLPSIAECSSLLHVLSSFGADEQLDDPLDRLASSDDDMTRFFATFLRAEACTPETLSTLSRGLRDPSLAVRTAAAYGLRRCADPSRLDTF